ncbi:MAG: nuclear transport factor 2 family protein [Bacteroidota bacterium]
MQKLIFIIMLLSTLHLQGQERQSLEQRISQLFIATDERDWENLKSIFAEEVELDYSSMSGNPAAKLSPSQIIESWKTILPGFSSTHHQIGNFQVEVQDKVAQVFCYGTATHYLEDPAGNVWTVVGSYNFQLKPDQKESWRVSSMRFNYKYMDGNLSLPQKAMNAVTSGSSNK